MRWTIFNTPLITPLLRGVAHLCLRVSGWRADGVAPDIPKFIVVGAPHTSNWDLPVTVICAFAFNRKIYWLGKETLFRPLYGWFFRWLGGVRVDRQKPQGVVEQAVAMFNDRDEFILVISPEGTRKHVKRWKTGFYRIAVGAGVPILLCKLDYGRKAGVIGTLMTPTGDFAADMKLIREEYAGITARNPELAELPEIPPEE